MNTHNLVAFLAAARTGQIQEIDPDVLQGFGLDGSVLNLTVENMADHLVAHDRLLHEEHKQDGLKLVQLAQLEIERLQNELERKHERLQHERAWTDGQIQMLTHRCEQYEAILPGLSGGNTRWMSFRTWWFAIGVLFLVLWAFKSDYAVDSLIFSIGWIASYSGVFLGKVLSFCMKPLRDLIRLPAFRHYAPRLERESPQPVRVG
ncbi:hypothetical protein OU800_21985 [Pseudomonas sp. GOM7]|uniref:hypothetical protein n=1 Tax=Pseudomonas sp. GOM7 TaxID=2998079 RepID=UPI00227CAFD5|nr:hypothetical protein [Pseudomonas sp. GOM7]WAJ37246.1 hypothetical protein OU800_21985 [Pseudomonas sp. GOM7]